MPERIRLSGQHLTIDDVARYHQDVRAALYEFFAGKSGTLDERHTDKTIEATLCGALAELEMRSALAAMSSIEAAVRVDYFQRVLARLRDPLSCAMQSLYQDKANRVRLEGDLFRLWRSEANLPNALLSSLVGVFRYRHWLAHGRYWTPISVGQHNFNSVCGIARQLQLAMEGYGKNVNGRSESDLRGAGV